MVIGSSSPAPPALYDGEASERIAEFIAKSLRPYADDWEREGAVPAEAYRRLGDLGAWASRWPEGARSPGNVALGMTTIREVALSSVGAAIAVATHQETFFRALDRSDWGREHWEDALAGDLIGALAVSERGSASNPGSCRTTARRAEHGWVISGHKHYVSNVPAATDIAVFARTSDRPDLGAFTIFVVPKRAAGVVIDRLDLIGAAAAGTCMVDFDEVHIGDDRRAGRVGSGLPLLLDLLRWERLAAASSSVAIAELCLEIALAWAARRVVHGRPLRQHQSVAHRLAVLDSDIAGARAFVRDRIELAQAGQLTSAHAAQAKFVLTRLAWRAADEAMQLVAGHGYTEETGLARLWRDVRVGRIGGGTDEVQLELIAQAMKPGSLAAHPLVRSVLALADA